MTFWKYNGAGNDFLILNNMDTAVGEEEFPALARALCDRNFSVGADGLMAVEPSRTADFRMRFYNADGSEGEMCGNGARCICRYGYETGLAGAVQRVESPSGPVTGERLGRREYRVRLTDTTLMKTGLSLTAGGAEYRCDYIELGSPGLPHAAVELPGLREVPEAELFELGRALRWNPVFPKGANVNFYELLPDGSVWERTFERGVEGFTLACGTGTAAVALSLVLHGKADPEGVVIDMKGGRLTVRVGMTGKVPAALWLSGPADRCALIEVPDEELRRRLREV